MPAVPYFFALLGLFFSSATVSYASPPSSDEVPFCLPFDYERERGTTYAAGKQTDLDVGEPRTVRMIYLLPNDRPFRTSVIDSMKTTIRQVQTFYAEQMQAHGLGNTTFRFETDAEGEPLVHRVDGQYPQTHYFDDTVGTVLDEVKQEFDINENVYLIVADISLAGIGVGGSRAGGAGGGWRNGGYAIVPSETILVPSERGWIVTAHELGHAFGLWHDFRDDAYIMSYGRQPNSLSMCNAQFLTVHPYFNPNVNAARRRLPTITLISPQTYLTDAKSVSIQLKVSDSQGLHQAVLLANYQIQECRELDGEKEAVVIFDYDGGFPSVTSMSLSDPIVHSMSVHVVGTSGNVAWKRFSLWDVAADKRTQPRPQRIVKISGDNQQGATNEPLANPLIVEVRDQHGALLQDVPVTFTVIRGDGTLTVDNTTTDANGRAQSALTLGPEPGTNMVLVSVERLVPEIFNALGSPPIATLINDTLTDFSLFADAFGRNDLRFDLDANGTVDFADFFLFAEAADEAERDQLFALAQELIGLPEGTQLYQNAPNPFNSQTMFSYLLLTPGPTRLEVFTLAGQRVSVLSTGLQQAGRHRLAWDGRDSEGRPLASGVYLYRLVSAEGVLTRKLILLR